MLGRIEELEPQLQAYATVMSATALAAAEQAETEIAAGRYRGPLHGIPVAVKDLCYTKAVPTMGIRSTSGSLIPLTARLISTTGLRIFVPVLPVIIARMVRHQDKMALHSPRNPCWELYTHP